MTDQTTSPRPNQRKSQILKETNRREDLAAHVSSCVDGIRSVLPFHCFLSGMIASLARSRSPTRSEKSTETICSAPLLGALESLRFLNVASETSTSPNTRPRHTRASGPDIRCQKRLEWLTPSNTGLDRAHSRGYAVSPGPGNGVGLQMQTDLAQLTSVVGTLTTSHDVPRKSAMRPLSGR